MNKLVWLVLFLCSICAADINVSSEIYASGETLVGNRLGERGTYICRETTDSYTRCEKERGIELLKMNSPRYVHLYQPLVLRRFALGEIDLTDKQIHLLRVAQQERARGNRARFEREFRKPVAQGPKLFLIPSPFFIFSGPHPGGYEASFGRAAGKFQGGRISGADFERELDEYLKRKATFLKPRSAAQRRYGSE